MNTCPNCKGAPKPVAPAKPAPKKPDPLSRFMALHASIERQLNELVALQAEHYGVEADSVNWGHVTMLADIDRKLRELREDAGCEVAEDFAS